jgi:hypothetical protein
MLYALINITRQSGKLAYSEKSIPLFRMLSSPIIPFLIVLLIYTLLALIPMTVTVWLNEAPKNHQKLLRQLPFETLTSPLSRPSPSASSAGGLDTVSQSAAKRYR